MSEKNPHYPEIHNPYPKKNILEPDRANEPKINELVKSGEPNISETQPGKVDKFTNH